MNAWKKIKHNAGMTLAETLLAVLILLLASSIVATGIPAARNAYEKVILSSNAELLLSTTIMALRNNLSTAKNIQINADNRGLSYYDTETGYRYTLDNKGPNDEPNDRDGIWIYEGEKDKGRRLISEASSTAASKGDLYVTFTAVSLETGESGKHLNFKKLQVKHGSSILTELEDYSIRVIAN